MLTQDQRREAVKAAVDDGFKKAGIARAIGTSGDNLGKMLKTNRSHSAYSFFLDSWLREHGYAKTTLEPDGWEPPSEPDALSADQLDLQWGRAIRSLVEGVGMQGSIMLALSHEYAENGASENFDQMFELAQEVSEAAGQDCDRAMRFMEETDEYERWFPPRPNAAKTVEELKARLKRENAARDQRRSEEKEKTSAALSTSEATKEAVADEDAVEASTEGAKGRAKKKHPAKRKKAKASKKRGEPDMGSGLPG